MSPSRIAVLFVLAGALPASAQPGPLPEAVTLMVEAQPSVAAPPFAMGVGPVDLVSVEPFGAATPVAGAPYSAEAVTDVTQTLADGNRIERHTTARIARDGKGRVRREQQVMALGSLLAEAERLIVTISDPVAGSFVTLDLGRKVAIRGKAGMFSVATARGVAAGSARVVDGKLLDTRIIEGGAALRLPPAGVTALADVAAPESLSVQTETLGSREFDGIRADGQRTTTTIPAGAIGNQLPIEIVSERWFSPELQVIVFTRRADPRFGETIYRLTNVVRAEPAAALFQIPADFRIEEPTMNRTRPRPEGE